MSPSRKLFSVFTGIVMACGGVFASVPAASADPGTGSAPGETPTDAYVLSPVFENNGRVLTSRDGVEVTSGKVDLDHLGATPKRGYSTTTKFYMAFGSSYVKSSERLQYWYDGTAYASGKNDYYTGLNTKRVIEVCFKYVRAGKDLIGWQCSKAGLGPVFTPGPVVKKTVRDTLHPFAPKTTFHYSLKTA